jgi:hypothetical protein
MMTREERLEKRRVRDRAQYARNPEKVLAACKRWKQSNRDKVNDWARRDYAANPEKIKLRANRWLEANPERRRAIKARWRAKHRAEYNAAQKRWGDNNVEKRKEIAHRSYKKHWRARLERVIQRLGKERYNARCLHHVRLRHARKKAVTIGDVTAIAKVYDRARWWKQWFDVDVDHITPLSKGGMHEATNLQIIYGFENNRKYNNPSYKPRVIFV